MLADAHAGGRDQQISSRRPAQVVAQAFLAVAGDPEIDGFSARAANQGVERVRVRARDLPARENLVALLELDDLIARSHERDPRPAMHQRRIVPAGSTTAPLRMSSPRRRMFFFASRALRIVTCLTPPAPSPFRRGAAASVSSWRITVSAPCGRGAPVKMRVASA